MREAARRDQGGVLACLVDLGRHDGADRDRNQLRRPSPARYDADQIAAAFAARLKDTVDLSAVRDDLTGIVSRALEPAHVSVWISRPQGRP